jgi:hypothetical protein
MTESHVPPTDTRDPSRLDLLAQTFSVRDALHMALEEVARAAVDYPGPAQDPTFVKENMLLVVSALDSLRALMGNLGLGHDVTEQRYEYEDLRGQLRAGVDNA